MYLRVLCGAVACYASLGAVIRIVPGYVGSSLGRSAAAVGLAVGAPAITAVVTRPAGGRLADRHGARAVAVAGAVAMALAALPMFGGAYAWFLASRLLVGIGEGAMMSATVLWLLRLAGPDRRGRALGHVGLANYAGLTIGPLLADAAGGSGHARRVFVVAALLPLAGLAVAAATRSPGRSRGEAIALAPVVRGIVRPGLGLLLVNVGYVALLGFGAGAAGGLVVPLYAATVIAVRTLGAGIPDRVGGLRTLTFAAPAAAAGLLMLALLPRAGALAGVIVLGVGQAVAVPALGLLALDGVPAERQGVAAGAFFAWFDGGVGIGGPLVGGIATAGGGGGALVAGAAAVAASRVAMLGRTRRRERR